MFDTEQTDIRTYVHAYIRAHCPPEPFIRFTIRQLVCFGIGYQIAPGTSLTCQCQKWEYRLSGFCHLLVEAASNIVSKIPIIAVLASLVGQIDPSFTSQKGQQLWRQEPACSRAQFELLDSYRGSWYIADSWQLELFYSSHYIVIGMPTPTKTLNQSS